MYFFQEFNDFHHIIQTLWEDSRTRRETSNPFDSREAFFFFSSLLSFQSDYNRSSRRGGCRGVVVQAFSCPRMRMVMVEEEKLNVLMVRLSPSGAVGRETAFSPFSNNGATLEEIWSTYRKPLLDCYLVQQAFTKLPIVYLDKTLRTSLWCYLLHLKVVKRSKSCCKERLPPLSYNPTTQLDPFVGRT